MDRGGRGYGGTGQSRQSSSLPRTLHGSLLQPDAGEAEGTADTLYDEPQPSTEAESTHLGNSPYAPHPRFARSAPAHTPSIAPAPPIHVQEQSPTHRDTAGVSRSHITSFERSLPQEPQLPTLPLPRIQTPVELYQQPQAGIPPSSGYSELQSYASTAQSSVAHLYNPSITSYPRAGHVPLPSLSMLQSGPQAGPSYSDPRYDAQLANAYRQRRWMTQHVDRPIVPLPRTARSQQQQPQMQAVPLGWNYQHSGPSSEYHGMQHLQSGMGDWPTGTRQDDISMNSTRNTSAHLSADRSTISSGPSFATAGRSNRYQYGVHISTPPPRRATQESQAMLTPYYGGQATAQYDPPPHPPGYAQQMVAPAPEQPPPMRVAQPEYIVEPEQMRVQTPSESRQAIPYGAGPSQPEQIPEERAQSLTPLPTSVASIASSSRKRKKEDSETSEEDSPKRAPKKTPIACHFCRNRKLKCDGKPTCTNCLKRSLPCGYAPEAKRRGPGKAPKGQRKLANQKAKATAAKPGEAATQAASESSQPSRAPSVSMPQEPQSRGAGDTMAGYPTVAGSQQAQLPQQQTPGSFGSGASFDFNFARTSSPQLDLTYSESAEVPREQYTRIFDIPSGLGGYSQPAPYISMSSRIGSERWTSGGPASGGRLRDEGQAFETGSSSSSPSSRAGQYYPPPPPLPGRGSPGR